MTARTAQWHLLGAGSDPVPHSTTAVNQLADTYEQTATAIRESTQRLRQLAELDGWTGDSAEAFAEAADDLHGDLGDAERRYEDAGVALRGFVTPVSTARSQSWSAVCAAQTAQEEIEGNSGDTLEGVAEPTDEQRDAQARREGRRVDAEEDLRSAQAKLDSALADLQTAAERAADGIRDAAKYGKDGFWDNVKGGLRDVADAIHLKTIVEVLGWVALAIAAVVLVVAVVATAPFWLVALGAAVGVALLAGNLVLWANGSGDAGWYDVALEVVGLVTLGFARPLTAGARAATTTARGAAATSRTATASADEAARLAASGDGIRAANASGMAPGNNLRMWSDATRAEHAAQASTAGTNAGDGVRAGVATRPGAMRALPYTDGELAQMAAEISRLEALPAAAGATVSPALQAARQELATAVANGRAGLAGAAVSGGRQVAGALGGDGPPATGARQDGLHWRLSDYEDG
ncbi:MAG: hypothetical protein H7323_16685 [Frankiales bacterium]|nr:hypothetical protein [Frankiales bacterium]